jgi:hypothetical protein
VLLGGVAHGKKSIRPITGSEAVQPRPSPPAPGIDDVALVELTQHESAAFAAKVFRKHLSAPHWEGGFDSRSPLQTITRVDDRLRSSPPTITQQQSTVPLV